MDSFYHNAAFVFRNMKFLLGLPCRFQNLLICEVLFVFFIIGFNQLIEDLSLFQTTMTDSSQNRFPVTETIFMHNSILILRFRVIHNLKSLGSGILGQHFLTFKNVIFLQFFLEPLVDLVLRLGTLYQFQPVTTWSLRILGSDDLDPVAVFNLVFNRNKFAVYSGTHHLISHCAVHTVGKIYRCGTAWKGFYISLRCKTVNTVCKKIQVILQKAHELFIIRHISLPLQDLA